MHQKFDRKCISCRQTKPQSEMLRFAKINNEVFVDSKHKLGGRGCYVCKDKTCYDLMIKKRLLNRSFKTNISQEIYDRLGDYEKNN